MWNWAENLHKKAPLLMFKRFEDEIKALAGLSTLVNSSLDFMEVLDNAMKYVEELMDAEASSIFEIDYERNELFFRLARGKEGDKARQIRLSIGEGIAGWVAREGKPLLVTDVNEDNTFSPRVDQHTGFKTRSIVCVPIKHKGRLIGVLQVLNKRREPFNEEDVELLTVVSNQLATAMENARLHQRLQEKFSLTCEELKKTQQKIIQSERLVALGKLSQSIAHEIRNPVMSIGGFARRLKQKLSTEDSGYHYVDIILKETARLEKMVKDVENYAGMPEVELREIKLTELIKHTLEEWWRDGTLTDIHVQLDLPGDEIAFPGDRHLLSLMLKNLFENAKEAMPKGGHLSISAHLEGQQIIIKIADNGSGISAEDIPQIFDPFFTSKPQGSGLGLTTVYRIVSQHLGEISVKSNPGEDTEFEIRLPLYPDDMQLSELEGRWTEPPFL
jgi:signal transduction histidine kinase